MVFAIGLEYKMHLELDETETPKRFYVIFNKLEINWNLEIMLKANEDVMDLVLINKYFSRDNLKFKVKNKDTWTDRIIFWGNDFSFNYNLGGRRFLKFNFQNVDTVETGKSWSRGGKGCMLYIAETFKVHHLKWKKWP